MSGAAPIPFNKWTRFLKQKGLIYIRTKGDHEIWDNPSKPYPRPITFRTGKKDVPFLHIKTCLRTIKVDQKDFFAVIKKL